MSRSVRTLVLLLLAAVPFTVTACSSDPASSSTETTAQVRVVDAAKARSLIDDGATVLDVRTPEEFATGHLRGATNLDVQAADFHERVRDLDKDARYVLYCRSGSRAGAAADMMMDMGFTDVVNAGGYDSLAAAGLPSE